MPRERIAIVRNAVNIKDFAVIESADEGLRNELGLGAGPVFGFIGSLYGYEGIDVLVAALPEIMRAHPQASVLLVGGGPSEPLVKQLAAKLGVSERVRFVGRVPNDQVRRYYSVIDVLAYPRKSTRLTELVTPLKPLEAMSLAALLHRVGCRRPSRAHSATSACESVQGGRRRPGARCDARARRARRLGCACRRGAAVCRRELHVEHLGRELP